MGNTFLNLALLIIFHFSMATISMKLTTILTDQSALLVLKDHVIHDPANVLTTSWSASALFAIGLVLPVQLSNLQRLKYLSFGINYFSGEIPSWLGSLTELRTLFLYQNNFKGVIPFSLGYLSKLEALYLFENQISGSIPSSIFNISSLQIINLSDNMLSGSIPSVPRDLHSLELIDFTTNNLTDHMPKDMFDHLPNLKELFLSFNLLSGRIPARSIPDNLGNLRNLKILTVENNSLTSSGMSFLFSLTICRVLENFLFCSNPFISGELPRVVGNLSSSLELFSAYSCNIRGSIPSEIGNLSHLINIELGGNQLKGQIPTTIGGLEELKSLSLDDNKLEGSIPSKLCHLNKLAFLFLTNNKLSGPIPACLGDLTSLSGPLSTDIGKWKVLTSLDLSNNQFSGDIPTGVADLKDLTDFSLSNNRIMGSIPESFDELLSLEFLDLSRNNLSREIPKSLEKLCYLKYFNVSFNRLEGEIPEGGSFENYTIESFKGNEALCGAARLHILNCKTRHLRNSKLRQATDGFNDSRLLGNGSYGSVFQGTLPDGTIIAVNVFKLELEGALKSFDVECDVLRNTRYRNLVKVISSCSNDLNFKALVLEFMPNGSLDKWLYSNNQYLDILQRLNVMIDVASALEYLHHGNATPVVHCDLKPNNVLLDEDMVAQLSDFGIVKLLCEDVSVIQTMTMATFGYMAPVAKDSLAAEVVAILIALEMFSAMGWFGKSSLIIELGSKEVCCWLENNGLRPWGLLPYFREIDSKVASLGNVCFAIAVKNGNDLAFALAVAGIRSLALLWGFVSGAGFHGGLFPRFLVFVYAL
ncbi:receptor kinase-like protein Xa21 [Gossypium arboreum]|uniref:receptor kinase-like protein Xa21 n=1 Tax=Gossypium arboreum TaxID=29729 RepID=UPI0022F14A36|nr:receptor kinase-like protein Xa21 [Gossypium arboreum]